MLSSMGLRIRSERQKLKLTQAELADKLGVSGNYIGSLERGEKSCSLDTLIKLSQILDVSTDFLLIGDKSVTYNPNNTDVKQLLFYLYHNIECLHKNNIPMVTEILRTLSKFLSK